MRAKHYLAITAKVKVNVRECVEHVNKDSPLCLLTILYPTRTREQINS